MERTLLLLKPDAIQRGLVGAIIARSEGKGSKLVGMRMLLISPETANQLYAEHVGRDYFERLVGFATSSPAIALALEGDNAVARVRTLIGKTLPDEAAPGTIRGNWSSHRTLNLVHSSDAEASAVRELPLFFAEQDLVEYERCDEPWLGAGT